MVRDTELFPIPKSDLYDGTMKAVNDFNTTEENEHLLGRVAIQNVVRLSFDNIH
jgi:hypothetical protein